MLRLALALLLLAWPSWAQMESAPGGGPVNPPVRGASNPWYGDHNYQPEQALVDGTSIYPPTSSGVWKLTVGGASHVIRCPLSVAAVEYMLFEITEGTNVASFDNNCYAWAAQTPPTFTVNGYDEVICHSRTPTLSNPALFTCSPILNAAAVNTSNKWVQGKVGAQVASGTTVTVTLPAAATTGNTIICMTANTSVQPSGVSDPSNATYTGGTTGTINTRLSKLWWKTSIAGTPSVITATWAASDTVMQIACAEVTSVTTIVSNLNNSQSSPGAGADAITSGATSGVTVGDILVGFGFNNSGTQSAIGTGFTLGNKETSGTGFFPVIEYRTALTTTPACTFTDNTFGASNFYSTGCVAAH